MIYFEKHLIQLQKAVDGLSSTLGRRALRHGVVASLEHRRMLRFVQPTWVIDVGSNRGQFALEVARTLPGTRVLSFEPLPSAVSVYRNIFEHLDGFEVRELALGASPGKSTLHIACHDDSSSLLPITPAQTSHYPGTSEKRTLDVRISTLSRELSGLPLGPSALLKIDVQGGELRVLQGAGQFLKTLSSIYVECSFTELYSSQPLASDIISWLQGRGFELSSVGPVSWSLGRAVQADLLFSAAS